MSVSPIPLAKVAIMMEIPDVTTMMIGANRNIAM